MNIPDTHKVGNLVFLTARFSAGNKIKVGMIVGHEPIAWDESFDVDEIYFRVAWAHVSKTILYTFDEVSHMINPPKLVFSNDSQI